MGTTEEQAARKLPLPVGGKKAAPPVGGKKVAPPVGGKKATPPVGDKKVAPPGRQESRPSRATGKSRLLGGKKVAPARSRFNAGIGVGRSTLSAASAGESSLEPSMTQRGRDWLAQAEHDSEQALASQRDGRHDWACLAAHQAGARAVKALQLAQGQNSRSPVISRLLTQLSPLPPNASIDQARILDNYYVAARYPHGHAEGPAFEHYGALQSSQGITYAGNVLEFANKALAEVQILVRTPWEVDHPPCAEMARKHRQPGEKR